MTYMHGPNAFDVSAAAKLAIQRRRPQRLSQDMAAVDKRLALPSRLLCALAPSTVRGWRAWVLLFRAAGHGLLAPEELLHRDPLHDIFAGRPGPVHGDVLVIAHLPQLDRVEQGQLVWLLCHFWVLLYQEGGLEWCVYFHPSGMGYQSRVSERKDRRRTVRAIPRVSRSAGYSNKRKYRIRSLVDWIR
jgi:hypothetical protein